jgi:hypothetical protein
MDFSSVGYMLLQALRRLGLQGTQMAAAQCNTSRLKLLKMGAQIKITVGIWNCSIKNRNRWSASSGGDRIAF